MRRTTIICYAISAIVSIAGCSATPVSVEYPQLSTIKLRTPIDKKLSRIEPSLSAADVIDERAWAIALKTQAPAIFEAQVRQAMRDINAFSDAASGNAIIRIRITELSFPEESLSKSASTTVEYQIVDAETGTTIMETTIASTGIAPTSFSLSGALGGMRRLSWPFDLTSGSL
ncbi:MAG: hypothetical protein IPL58_07730 [Betaproteobacteria bacterium]|uniref:DUF4410 domain-containing protein n=1 Tax=Candidatus Proximibacter danicus TaxID=2954365 RepID=A0A9D7K0I4_9PROT|nr:hypothetical protein [Candidatus Proximibacter danicus]